MRLNSLMSSVSVFSILLVVAGCSLAESSNDGSREDSSSSQNPPDRTFEAYTEFSVLQISDNVEDLEVYDSEASEEGGIYYWVRFKSEQDFADDLCEGVGNFTSLFSPLSSDSPSSGPGNPITDSIRIPNDFLSSYEGESKTCSGKIDGQYVSAAIFYSIEGDEMVQVYLTEWESGW